MTAAAEPLELRLPDRAGVEHRFVLTPRPDAVLFSGQWQSSAKYAEIDVRWVGNRFVARITAAGTQGVCTACIGESEDADAALDVARGFALRAGITADDLLGAPA